MSLDASERSLIIDAAMNRKLGDLLNWKRPELLHSFGANDLDFIDEFEERLGETIQKLNTAFEAMADDVLIEIGDELSDPMRIGESEWGALDALTIDRLDRDRPPNIAFGFGHPDLAADFAYWGCMPKLGLYEVTALSVGADPKKISEEYIEKRLKLSKENRPLWSADAFLVQRREIFTRYFSNTGWGFVSEPIAQVRLWIDQMSMTVHPEFYSSLVQRLDQPSPNSATADEAKTFTNQERDTLLKLIAAMSCEQYGYNPNAKRSTVPSNVKDDLERLGLGMDDKTIRKWLREASHFVSSEYWQGQS